MGFGNMFDKLDDIVYEPVKLVCDALRRPLDMLDKHNQKKTMEFEQQLQQNAAEFDFKLEERRKRLDNELIELAKNQEFERNSRIVDAIKRYQIDLGEAAKKIAESIGLMSVDLQNRAYNIVDERNRNYKEMQEKAIAEAQKRLFEIEEKFPNGGRAKEIMENAIEKLMTNIIDEADNFIRLMEKDLSDMTKEIREIAAKTLGNSDKYLSPMAVSGNLVSDKIETISTQVETLIEHDETIQ